MRVLLVSVNNEIDPYPVAPIGAAYVATALNTNGHDVRLLDLCFVEDDCTALTEYLNNFSPNFIGISLRNIDNLTYNRNVFYLPRIKHIVSIIKKTSIPVVIGGSGFSIFPEDILRYLQLDTGIVGEGETAFSLFVDAVSSGGSTHDIPNLCYIENGEFKINEILFSPINYALDRNFLDNGRYYEFGGMANIQAKRGCPFKCTYCTYPNIDGDTLRCKDPGRLVEELKELELKYKIGHVFFVVDIFNFPEEHAVAICEEILRNNLQIGWTCFATPKGMTAEVVKLMKRAGCKGVEFGSDACSAKTLKGLGKSFSTDDIVSAAEQCESNNLPSAHYILIGGPGENSATLDETFSLFNRINATAVIALIGIRIYPDTLIHCKAIEDGVVEKDKNLLEPVFYLAPDIEPETLLSRVYKYAMQSNNWIVPGLDIRCDTNVLAALRKMGKRGPLWDLVS